MRRNFFSLYRESGWSWPDKLDVVSLLAQSKHVKYQLDIAQDIQYDAQTDSRPTPPPWHVDTHPDTRTGTVSNGLMSYLPMRPYSLWNCNGHARLSCRVVERLVDCSIQEIDGIRGPGDQSSRAWPWTHHWISYEISANGSSSGVCLTKCGGDNDDQESVWGIVLCALSDIQLPSSGYKRSLDCADKDMASSSSDQPRPHSRRWEKTLSPHDTEKGTVLLWCNHIRWMPT